MRLVMDVCGLPPDDAEIPGIDHFLNEARQMIERREPIIIGGLTFTLDEEVNVDLRGGIDVVHISLTYRRTL